jgi:predicted RNase H-like HicB family nuclease
MLYPVYVEMGDETHAHSMVIPDFPGCFSAADEWERIPAMVQEAVEVWIEGEDVALPQATALEVLASRPDYQYGGVWMLVDVDVSRLRPARIKRINITLPEDVLQRIDTYAGAHHMTRSGFLAKAAESAIRAG